MNQSGNSAFKLRDIAHAAVLLVLVPVVFYGGYQLVSHSADTEPEPINLVTQAVESAKQATTSWTHDLSPPPGASWIEEVDRLKKKLSSIGAIDSSTMEQKNRLDDQLTLFHEHCEAHVNDLHYEIGHETHLGRTLLRFANEIDRLRPHSPQATQPENWETEFETSESIRLAQLTASTNAAFEEQAAPMRRAHATQLASITRQNRQLADELQRTLDSIERIETTTRENLAKRERLAAYTKDKDDIARLLKPSITPGYSQLRDNWNDWKKTAEKRPLSYRDLERLGALATDIKGVRTFARIGGMPTHMYPNSARPLGGFPAYYDHTLSNPTQLEIIKRAQQLIKEHSVYLIEAGLLQP